MAQASETLQGNGFVIENCIIKGDNKSHDVKEDGIGELIFNTLSEAPECVGHVDALTGKRKTFSKIKEQSICLATWMRKEGFGSEDTISICTPIHVDQDITFYASTFIGATCFLFPSQVDLITSRRLIKTMKARLIFANKSIIHVLEEAAKLENHKWKVIVFDKDNKYESLNDILETSLSEEIELFEVSKVSPDHTCLLSSTSGTTGTPKYTSMDYKNVMLRAISFDIVPKSISSNQIALTYEGLQSDIQVLFSVKCLLNRWIQVFHNNVDSDETYKIIEKYKINILHLDVGDILVLKECGTINKYDLKSVTFIHSSGSKLFDEVRRKLLDIFPNVSYISRGFGMTEVSLVTLFTTKCRNPHSEGSVVPNVQIKIIDKKTGIALGHNKVGKLCIKSPCVVKGYYNNPEANKLAFDHEGWFHSGDEAYYDDNGELVVVGRSKEIIKYRGSNLYPLYIEQSLFTHPDIADAAVVGIHHAHYVEQPVAFVKLTQGSNVKEKDILKLMPELEYSDTFKNRIIFTDDIPRSDTGKINRRILKERAEKFYKSN